MTYAGRIALGVDIGTSTCQAWMWINGAQQPMWVGSAGGYRERYFPSLIYSSPRGRSFGHAARLDAAHAQDGMLHRNFKAFLKPDCPITRHGYTIDKALSYFREMAVHYTGLLMPEIVRRASTWDGKVRVDVTYTLPGGWRSDPNLEQMYRQVIDGVAEQLTAEFGQNRVDVKPLLLEEPVAAFIAADEHRRGPVSSAPALLIDAGGGTLDVAACTRRPGTTATYEVEFTRSIGIAGGAIFEAFVAALVEARAFTPALPARWEAEPALYVALEELFQTYHATPGDSVTQRLPRQDPSLPTIAVGFSRSRIDARIMASKQLQDVGAFLDELLEDFGTKTKAPLLDWSEVLVAGGLAHYAPFMAVVRRVYPKAQVVADPQEAIARGAMLFASTDGNKVAARRCVYHLAQLLYQRGTDRLMYQTVVPAQTKIAAGNDKPWVSRSAMRGNGSAVYTKLAWTRSWRVEDEVQVISEMNHDFGILMQNDDPMELELRFNEMLEIEATLVHMPTGTRRSRRGIPLQIEKAA